jgi:DNA-binding transcriptional regulator YhcF (GntR family)
MAFLNEIEGRIVDELREGPKTTRQISDNLKINWATADKYLNYLEGFGRVKSKETTKKLFYLKQKENYFDLPLTKEQENKINKIYQIISKTNKVTRTQAQKILFQANKDLNLKLPIGWYQFGPITIMPYENKDYQSTYNFDDKQISTIKEITNEYAKIDNFELEDEVYKQESNKLYLTKKTLSSVNFKKDDLNILLMDFLTFSPDETKELVTDYVRTVMLIGFNDKTKDLFNLVWKYVAIINFKNDLKKCYEYDIELYFDEKIKQIKDEINLILDNLVINYGEEKYSQEALYQKFVRHKK